MYSDAKKFPNSGGYVWLSDDARNKYVSVFKSSIFETIIQPPSVILKLIYHYVCQVRNLRELTISILARPSLRSRGLGIGSHMKSEGSWGS